MTGIAAGLMLSTLPVVGQALVVNSAIAQASTKTKGTDGASLIEQLKLTADQKQKIANVRRLRTTEMNKVLTPQQKTKFAAARKAGKNTSETMATLGLNPDQKKKVADIAKKSVEGIMAVLNPAQKKQVMTYLKQRRGGLE
jgi:Spy/CpxP family protein refolding chaperone